MKYSDRCRDVFYDQCDEGTTWYGLPYWDSDVGHEGCGLVALATCVELLSAQQMNPYDAYSLRRAAGLDQLHMSSATGAGVCGGDVTLRLNQVNEALFGIESIALARTVDAFREALSRDSVIWASSRNCFFLDNMGEKRFLDDGHVLCFWTYEDGIFYAKDCHFTAERGNNVGYSEKQLQQWLDGNPTQQFEIRMAEGDSASAV